MSCDMYPIIEANNDEKVRAQNSMAFLGEIKDTLLRCGYNGLEYDLDAIDRTFDILNCVVKGTSWT